MPPPAVSVSRPVERDVTDNAEFTGRTAAVESVQVRARVWGHLQRIHFKEGAEVKKGDLLFVIDPRPFQIRLDQAIAQLNTAEGKETLSQVELWRAQQLKQTNFGTAETVDQRTADLRTTQAAIETAKATIRDASLDLEFSRVTAPFTGRIGRHLGR